MSTTEIEDVTVTDEIEVARREQETQAATAIEREVAVLEGLIATTRGYAPEIEIARAFVAAFPPTEPGYIGRVRTSIGVGAHSLNGVLIVWDARRLQDVTPRVAWLAQRLGKFKIEDYAEIGRRTYDFGRVKFSVFFNTYDACHLKATTTDDAGIPLCDDCYAGLERS